MLDGRDVAVSVSGWRGRLNVARIGPAVRLAALGIARVLDRRTSPSLRDYKVETSDAKTRAVLMRPAGQGRAKCRRTLWTRIASMSSSERPRARDAGRTSRLMWP